MARKAITEIDFDKEKLQYYDTVLKRNVRMLARHASDLDNPEGRLNILITAKSFHFLITQVQKMTDKN